MPETPGSEAESINSDGSFFFMRRDDGSHAQISAHHAFLKLDQFARQQFIMSLNNREVEEPVEGAFPSMSANDATFRSAVQKVRDLYKTWKNRTLTEAEGVFRDIVVVAGNGLSEVRDFKVLGAWLSEHFQEWWLSRVFPWAEEAVRWDECSPNGMRWARCELSSNCSFGFSLICAMPDVCIQLIARARLCSLYGRQNQRDPRLCRYDRGSLLSAFDGLYTRQKGMQIEITVNDFPMRVDPVRRRRRRRDTMDMNEDSDGEVGDGAPCQKGYSNDVEHEDGDYIDEDDNYVNDGLGYIREDEEVNQETLTTENDGGSFETDDLEHN